MTRRLHLPAAVLLCILLMVPATASAQDTRNGDFNLVGRAAFQFLKIGGGARQAAMGDASIATTADANSVFFNPAGIAAINRGELSFSYAQWFADMNYMAAAGGVRWGRVGVFGFQIAGMNYGELQETIVTDGSGDPRTGATFGGSNLLLGVTYTREFTDRLAIGVTTKLVYETLWQYRATQYAFDVGTMYDLGFNGLRLAMSAQNYSPGTVNWLEEGAREEGFDTPLLFRVGLSAGVIGRDAFMHNGAGHALLVSAESVNSNDFGERFHVGGEYSFNELLMLRAGYRFNYADGNLTLGFGLNTGFGGANIRVDYAYMAYEFLNSPHRMTMTLGF